MNAKWMLAAGLALVAAGCGGPEGPHPCPMIDGSSGKGWWVVDAGVDADATAWGGPGACIYPCAYGYGRWIYPTRDGGFVYGRCYR